jgi:hypothetical protein
VQQHEEHTDQAHKVHDLLQSSFIFHGRVGIVGGGNFLSDC